MKKSFMLILVASLLTVTNVNAADDKKTTEKSPWKSSVELGFIRTTGNTETQTTAVKADATYEVDKWRHNAHAEGYGQQSKADTGETVVSAERYQASGKSDYKFSELDYIFGLVKLQKDRFSGFVYDHVVSAGYGRKLIKQNDMELDLEIGPGARFFKVEPAPGVAGAGSESEAVLRLSGKYWWAISGNSKFTQELSTDIGETITSTQSVTGLQANINSTLALKFTYTVRHKTKVPDGNEKLDTETAMTLVYSF
jgi:putative salt-induced outer membrane protein YdiY